MTQVGGTQTMAGMEPLNATLVEGAASLQTPVCAQISEIILQMYAKHVQSLVEHAFRQVMSLIVC